MVIVIFAFGVVSTIITHNKTKNGSDDKPSTPLPNILIKETRNLDSKSKKSRAIQTKEELQFKCKQKADKLLMDFTNEIFFNDRHKKLYTAVRRLKYIFVSSYFFCFFVYFFFLSFFYLICLTLLWWIFSLQYFHMYHTFLFTFQLTINLAQINCVFVSENSDSGYQKHLIIIFMMNGRGS